MTDKELLELAARAAGIEGSWGCEGYIERHEGFIPTDWRRAWSPLTDDGDAFRLAVKLGIDILISPVGSGNTMTYGPFVKDSGIESERFVEDHNDDPYAATRRAITRAAAAIGKEMSDE